MSEPGEPGFSRFSLRRDPGEALIYAQIPMASVIVTLHIAGTFGHPDLACGMVANLLYAVRPQDVDRWVAGDGQVWAHDLIKSGKETEPEPIDNPLTSDGDYITGYIAPIEVGVFGTFIDWMAGSGAIGSLLQALESSEPQQEVVIRTVRNWIDAVDLLEPGEKLALMSAYGSEVVRE